MAAHADQTVKYPLKQMFWGCFLCKCTGCRSLMSVEGMINFQKYRDLLKNKLEAELRKVNVNGKQFSNKIRQYEI